MISVNSMELGQKKHTEAFIRLVLGSPLGLTCRCPKKLWGVGSRCCCMLIHLILVTRVSRSICFSIDSSSKLYQSTALFNDRTHRCTPAAAAAAAASCNRLECTGFALGGPFAALLDYIFIQRQLLRFGSAVFQRMRHTLWR